MRKEILAHSQRVGFSFLREQILGALARKICAELICWGRVDDEKYRKKNRGERE
jgi:hypothetical protein